MNLFRWNKRELIFQPKGNHGWMNSHAQVPTPLVRGDTIRIFFSSRPRRDLSLTTFVDVDRRDPSRVLYVHPRPVLDPGGSGSFDEHGIMPSSCLDVEGVVYLYYSGWARCNDVPYRNYTGLAISEDGGTTFRKHDRAPVLGSGSGEPLSASSPLVVRNSGWHMWYSSGVSWIQVQGRREHVYDLKYARSKDGKDWTVTGETVVRQAHAQEALTRPAVLRREGKYHWWFSFRGSVGFRGGADGYRIGYACSGDLRQWFRDDATSGIGLSAEGWDSQMVAYPAILDLGDSVLMFYNGNDFGHDGFGYAVLDETH